MSDRHILFMLPSLQLGGAERQALLLARNLAVQHRARVSVWGFSKAGRVSTLCDEAGIPWRSIALPRPGARAKQLAALVAFGLQMRQARPDIVLPYTFIPNIWCGLTWRWSGARGCIWNQRSACSTHTAPWLERWAVRLTPRFIGNSPHLASELTTAYRVPAGRVDIVPNGIELAAPEANRTVWRARLGVDPETPVVCMVANLTDLKDHATLLRAWRIVRDRPVVRGGAEPVLVLAGYFGNRHSALLDMAEELQLGTSIRFVGQVTDVSGLLDAIEISVLSSQAEGSPNGVLECMAAGLPVVGTDVAGICEAVGPSGLAHLAPIQDADALADRLIAFLENSALRADVGKLNRARIKDRFSPDRMCERMVSLIDQHLTVQ